MRKRTPLERPIISAPIGPVKSSRGPDLTRSDKFEVVAGIKDCTNNPSTPSDSIASRRSRRISAGFLNIEALSSSPTVVESEVSAVTRIQADTSFKGSLGRRAAPLSLSTRSLLKQPSKYTLVARPQSAEDTENIPPLNVPKDDKKSSIPRSMSKLPKSRTMMVLHDLKKSFSRPSLAAVKNNNHDQMQPAPNVQSLRKLDESELSMSTFQSSQTTLTSFSLIDHSSNSSPVPSIKHVGTAQSSEYWSGRFMALHDRFSSESFANYSSSCAPPRTENGWQSRLALPGGHSVTATQNRLTYLAPSNTTSALTTITYNARSSQYEDEDDSKCKRIFSHLESLCTTTDAKASLHSWQQTYARRYSRPKLLPEGGCMYDKSRKNRFLVGVGHRFKSGERRRLLAFKELEDSRPGAAGVTPGRGVAVY